MAENYYQTLGVSPSATPEEIQKAYRKLARKYHPDLLADKDDKAKEKAKQNFQRVQHAYDVLSEPEKRKMYDQFGDQYEQVAGGGNPFGGQGGGGMGGFDDILRQMGGMEGAGRGAPPRGGMGGFEEILRQFGGRGRGNAPPKQPAMPAKGEDIEQEITVPFAVSVLGGLHQVQLRRANGKIESLEVKIPAGIESAQKIRLRGQGFPHPAGGPNGDLMVTVKVASHPKYVRSGLNLNITVPITVREAAEGAKIELSTPHGKVSLSVPPGSSSGKSLRLRGMGIRTKDRSGDLIATLQISVPTKVSPADLELLKKLSSEWTQSVRADLKW